MELQLNGINKVYPSLLDLVTFTCNVMLILEDTPYLNCIQISIVLYLYVYIHNIYKNIYLLQCFWYLSGRAVIRMRNKHRRFLLVRSKSTIFCIDKIMEHSDHWIVTWCHFYLILLCYILVLWKGPIDWRLSNSKIFHILISINFFHSAHRVPIAHQHHSFILYRVN